MKITICFKLISIVSILVVVVLGLTITQSVNAWRQRSAAVQFGDSEAAASAVLEAGSLMAVERGTTNAVYGGGPDRSRPVGQRGAGA